MKPKTKEDRKEMERGSDYNKVILTGNLTNDPELRYTPSGAAVTSLRLAVNHRYRQKDRYQDEISYFDIITFGKQAESCVEYLTKGRYVLIDGRLQERRWESEEGQRRAEIEVIANQIYSLGELKELNAE
jgi:single-strand DNA-binding protein